jgi:hydrogenase nickel incorporation protein HypA/HybF
MHEVSIIEDLIEEVKSLAKRQNAYKVTKLKIKIGKLEHISHDTFNLWFRELSKGSIAEGAKIEIVTSYGAGVYLESMEMETDE